jgi:gliding motility-associated-like protein
MIINKNNFLFVCAFLFFFKTHAQLGFCSGNSGDPIFSEDFGAGNINNPLPIGTTTYPYSAGYPGDGYYTVSNGTFGNGFDWHQIQDHTIGDVNGKCLIVNAGFSSGEFYRTIVSGLCETTTYEFSAWLINLVIPGSFCSTQPGGTIPINVSFEIWDNTDTNLLSSGSTGNIFESIPNWEEYGLIFQTLAGQNAVILKIINNGQGGCGNDLAIDDLEFKTCGDAVIVEDSLNNDSINLCSSQTPFTSILTAIPDFSVFSSHFYQWQQSTDGIIWTDIPGETNQNINITISTSMLYRVKVAEVGINLSNSQCLLFSEVYQIIVNEAPVEPTNLECWETATFNNTTCLWEVTGAQPVEPTNLECWETATFNNTTCLWEVTGTQPVEPTNLECWETATFNNTTCLWEVTGTQPVEPTNLECWETATFNNTTCLWEVTGIQPVEPTNLECWEISAFNNVTCSWEVNGTQPVEIDLECWETSTFNNTTCLWEVTGIQPVEPTNLDCWETTMFNNINCTWEINGFQPIEPQVTCNEMATFNNVTCTWDITEITIEPILETLFFCENGDVDLSADIDNASYVWNTGDITKVINVDEVGIYSVQITDVIGCITSKIITVNMYDQPEINSIVSQGNSIIVNTTSNGYYEYSLDGNVYQPSNIFQSVEGGYYTIYVRNLYDCPIVISMHLHFIIPKFMTPNGDSYHDTFELRGIEFFQTSEVYVFDRFGKLLKSSKNNPFSWDGTFNNQLLPSSDYWYLIRIEGQEYRGYFTLKR